MIAESLHFALEVLEDRQEKPRMIVLYLVVDHFQLLFQKRQWNLWLVRNVGSKILLDLFE